MNNLKEFVSDVTGYMFLDYLKNISLKQTNERFKLQKKVWSDFFPNGFFQKWVSENQTEAWLKGLNLNCMPF